MTFALTATRNLRDLVAGPAPILRGRMHAHGSLDQSLHQARLAQPASELCASPTMLQIGRGNADAVKRSGQAQYTGEWRSGAASERGPG